MSNKVEFLEIVGTLSLDEEISKKYDELAKKIDKILKKKNKKLAKKIEG